MLEFFDVTYIHSARKLHTCECCGKIINQGNSYYKESGKFEGEFFSRCMCPVCHGIEMEYCSEVDNEFSWDSLIDYAQETVCYDCQHSYRYEDDDDWIECPYNRIQECPEIIKTFVPKEKKHEEKS